MQLVQRTPWNVVEYVCCDEFCLQRLFIAEQFLALFNKFGMKINTNKMVRWHSVEDKAAQVLPKTAAKIK